jgi:cytochrome oxidase Cu insertion factor (SCO1/SenC/PrrC family)
MGVVLMILGAVHHLATAVTSEPENAKRSRITAAHLIVGGYGFVFAFYLAGAFSVPRPDRHGAAVFQGSSRMSRTRAFVILAALLSALATAHPSANARRALLPVPGAPPDESVYVNRPVPDILLRTTAGERWLSSLWGEGPLVLTFVFTRCSGVCSPYLRALRAADDALDNPGDVRRVVLSFDPRDTAGDMRRAAEHAGVAERDGWTLGVGSPDDIAALTSAVGFWSTWDEGRQQFDHPALLAGIRDGRVSRLMIGDSITPARLGEVIREARGEFVASYPLPGLVRFRCFDYDPATGRATLAWGAVVMIVPAGVAALATVVLFRRGRRSV